MVTHTQCVTHTPSRCCPHCARLQQLVTPHCNCTCRLKSVRNAVESPAHWNSCLSLSLTQLVSNLCAKLDFTLGYLSPWEEDAEETTMTSATSVQWSNTYCSYLISYSGWVFFFSKAVKSFVWFFLVCWLITVFLGQSHLISGSFN